MKSTQDVNILIENKVYQDITDTDWGKVDGTVLKYKPSEVDINSASTNTSLVSLKTELVTDTDIIAIDDGNVVEGKIGNVVYDPTTIVTEVNQLTASDAVDDDRFGVSVAISGNGLVAVVGAHVADAGASNAGKVYTYKRATIDDTWTEVNQLTASDAEANDYFGVTVAISDDGLVVMVSAYAEDTAGADAGKVYTYKRATVDDTWTEVNQLTASDAQDADYYGVAVAMSSDGLVAIVGSYGEDSAATDAGKVYTYKRTTIDDVWVEVNTLVASDIESSDQYGRSVAMSSDGLVAVVGSLGEDSAGFEAGKVYTYKRATIDDAWTEVNQLTASDAQDYDGFGISTDMSGDGLVAIVGAYSEDSAVNNAGKVYIYKRATIDDAWTEVNQLTASDAEDTDYFGIGVGISSDGLVVMCGAYYEDTAGSNAGKVYTYNLQIEKWSADITSLALTNTPSNVYNNTYAEVTIGLEPTENALSFSKSISKITLDSTTATDGSNIVSTHTLVEGELLGIDGKYLPIGVVTYDGTSLYTADISNFSLTNKPKVVYKKIGNYLDKVSSTTSQFVGISKISNNVNVDDTVLLDSSSAVVIASSSVYVGPDLTIIDEVDQLVASDASVSDYFGAAVAMSGDGLVAIVSAYAQDSAAVDAGKVYTYKRDTIGDMWTEVNQLTASDAQDYDQYGRSVAMSSDGLVAMVGAFAQDSAALDGGKVYTYKRATIDDAWTEVTQLVASDAQDYDGFGKSVAISDDGLVTIVGAYAEDTAASNAGKVYTYKRATIDDAWTEVNQLTASDAESDDVFGVSVALSNGGLVAMIGANFEDSAAADGGKVYTYKRATIDDVWTEVNTLIASDVEDYDYYGGAVAMSDDGLVAIVGAHVEDTAGSNAGKVYLYKRDTIDDAWAEINQLVASDADASDYFGISVTISGDGLAIIVAASYEDSAGSNAGKVYNYKLQGLYKYTIDYVDQGYTTNTLMAYSKDILPTVLSLTYNTADNCLEKTYNETTRIGRVFQRAIHALGKDVEILTPLTTNMYTI